MSGTLVPHTLPLATTPAFTPGSTRLPRSNDGWGRAFERAIAGSVHESATRSATAPISPVARPEVHTNRPQLTLSTRSYEATVVASRALPPSAADAMEPVGTRSASADPPSSRVRETDEQLSTGMPASRTGRTGRKTTSILEPHLHVHVEQHADGLAVFLGMQGDAANVGARAAALLIELRRQVQGVSQRLTLVVCNGTPIHHNPPSSKEKP